MKHRTRPVARGRARTSVRLVRTARDLAAIRTLLMEYQAWLIEHREVTAFDDSVLKMGIEAFDRELASLPGEYGPPRGAMYLAIEGTTPVGCGALRALGSGRGEIKRLYVRSRARGAGLGRRITQALVNRARRLGYRRVVLDTLPRMTAAIGLYRRMGFTPTEPYWAHPVPDALFFARDL